MNRLIVILGICFFLLIFSSVMLFPHGAAAEGARVNTVVRTELPETGLAAGDRGFTNVSIENSKRLNPITADFIAQGDHSDTHYTLKVQDPSFVPALYVWFSTVLCGTLSADANSAVLQRPGCRTPTDHDGVISLVVSDAKGNSTLCQYQGSKIGRRPDPCHELRQPPKWIIALLPDLASSGTTSGATPAATKSTDETPGKSSAVTTPTQSTVPTTENPGQTTGPTIESKGQSKGIPALWFWIVGGLLVSIGVIVWLNLMKGPSTSSQSEDDDDTEGMTKVNPTPGFDPVPPSDNKSDNEDDQEPRVPIE